MAAVASGGNAAVPGGVPTDLSRWRAWLLAARPQTLAVSLGPVAVGTAVAASEGGARWLPALAALVGALLLQIGSNFANDAFDFEKGADGADRLGPPRAAQLGLLSPRDMKLGTAAVFAVALLVGLYLTAVAGWPVLVVGVVSMVAAVAYTGGPWAYGYKGLGDLMVFVFFGLVAVVGTHYVETLRLSIWAVAASVPVGALATAILVVNNLRDVDTDRTVGKRTLAVRLGRRGARIEYAALIALAYASPVFFWLAEGAGRSAWVLLPWLTLPLAIVRLRTVWSSREGPALNAALAGTAQLGLVFSLLLALGWWL